MGVHGVEANRRGPPEGRRRRRLVGIERAGATMEGVGATAGRVDRRTVPETASICAVGRAAGLAAVGVTRAERFERTRRDLEQRRDVGLHGGMAFTYRNPARSSDPTDALPDAAALVVGAWAYNPGPLGGRGRAHDRGEAASAVGLEGEPATGRVARYATEDHYGELRVALSFIADHLLAEGWRARVLADDNALVDREAAQRAGLGWYGRSANLLVPGHGPWVVLGSVLTDAPIPPTGDPVPDGCGSCRRCIDACPTAAIVDDGVVDARRCLSWRLQDAGVFPVELRVPLGDRIYGCDECLEVCPPGRSPESASVSPSGRSAAPGGFAPRVGDATGSTVDVLAMLAATDEELLVRHGRWYIARRDPANLRRNALVVLANVGDADDPMLRHLLAVHLADGRPVVRAHAVWTARRLALDALLDHLPEGPAGETDPWVRAELDADVAPRGPGGEGRPGSVRVDLQATRTAGRTSGRT